MTLRIAAYDETLKNAIAWLTTCPSTKTPSNNAEMRCTVRRGAVEGAVCGQGSGATAAVIASVPYQGHKPGPRRETSRNSGGLIVAIKAPSASRRVDA